MKKQSVRRQAAILTCCNAFTRALGFVLRIVLSRLLGAEAVGVMELSHSAHMLSITPVTAGVPLGVSGTTNLMKVHVVGHLLVRGEGIGSGSVTAPLVVANTYEEACEHFKTGDILVCRQTTRDMLPLVRKASGLILEDDNPEGHGAIAGISLDIPVIIGAANATNILKSGAVVTLNAQKGTVSCN